MNETTKQELKRALEKEHDLLVGELKSIARPDPKLTGDWDARFPKFEAGQTGEYGSHGKLEEAADEVEEYEVRLEAEHSLESRLLEVNKALERIKTNNYENCRTCRKEIPMERLYANPAADTHIEHA